VGPNGSGKSNLMDAISFVLGVRTSQLRGSLRELLYDNSEGSGAQDRPQRGYVRLVYCTDEDQEVAFSRHIQPANAMAAEQQGADVVYQSVYRINERHVSWEGYSQRLASFGIRVKIRNFLVFQVSAGRKQGAAALCLQPRTRSRGAPTCRARPRAPTCRAPWTAALSASCQQLLVAPMVAPCPLPPNKQGEGMVQLVLAC